MCRRLSYLNLFCCMIFCTFSALTLLVGRHEGHLTCKNWVVRYWCGYLSGARCKLFAYGPADATASPSSFAPLKFRTVYLCGSGLHRLSWKKAVKTHVVVVVHDFLCTDNAAKPSSKHCCHSASVTTHQACCCCSCWWFGCDCQCWARLTICYSTKLTKVKIRSNFVVMGVVVCCWNCMRIILHCCLQSSLVIDSAVVSVSSFRSTCPYHRNLFCCSINIISSIPSLSLNSLHGTLSFTLTSLLAEVPPHFLSRQARSHFRVAYHFAHNCYTASLS